MIKDELPHVWYLGLDFGTSHLAAALINVEQKQGYPLYWLSAENAERIDFKLPAMVYAMPGERSPTPSAHKDQPLFVVGEMAAKLAKNPQGIFLEKFKPFLQEAIPYYAGTPKQWHPQLQGVDRQRISLYGIRQAARSLLETLNYIRDQETSPLQIGAVGLSKDVLAVALSSLAGVMVSCPAQWGDTYRFNLREIILRSKLIREPGQIVFVEEAIAALWGHLLDRTTHSQKITSGMTLVIQGGATTTELALVDLPENLGDLTYADFSLHSFAYGGDALDQDILSQLLIPQWPSNLILPLEFPEVGQIELFKRYYINLQLQGSPIGLSLLEATKLVKLVLQKREVVTSTFGNKSWSVQRQDLEQKVILSVVEQINQQINILLSQKGTSQSIVTQVICSGGTSATLWPGLSVWLTQKFPNAALIYRPEKLDQSPVAWGLAHIPLFPKLIDSASHQYSDYFLLIELLKVVPEHSFRFEELLHLLQEQGINTRVCTSRILSLLKGELPWGLIPSTEILPCLAEASQKHREYKAIATNSLFVQETDQLYSPNWQQIKRLRQYLKRILAHTQQTLREPLLVKTIGKD